MNKKTLRLNILLRFLTLVILISMSCKNPNPVNLAQHELVEQDSLITWLQENRFPKPKGIKYLDSVNFEVPQDSIYRITNIRDVKLSYYMDNNKNLEYIKLTTASPEDKVFFDKMTEIENDKFNGDLNTINIVKVDCNKKGTILNDVFDKDVNNRKNGLQGINRLIDQQNLEIVYSLYDKCGDELFHDLDDKQITAIWLVIQHSSLLFRKEFYPVFRLLTDQNKFDEQLLIMMEDRILMDQNLPQKYGTQIQDDKLYKCDNMDSVNIRRKNIGLESIELYVKELNASF